MDLIYTNSQREDLGVLLAYSLDLSYGVDENENDFELVLGKSEPLLEDGAIVYLDGTEYGGVVSGLKSNSSDETRTSVGRTGHGLLNSKVIQPDPGQDYLIVSGDANEVLADLIVRLGLSDLFYAEKNSAGIDINSYKFPRYVKGYDGIRTMLERNGAKLKMRWIQGRVQLHAEVIIDFADQPVDGDEAALSVERYGLKVNHLICLGQGDLKDRDVIHLYVDQYDQIGYVQYYAGLEEVVAVYDYSSVESLDELRKSGIEYLQELRNIDQVSVTAYEGSGLEYDVGDIIGGTDTTTGNKAKATVVQKIVRINNGAISVDYKTGIQQTSAGRSGGSGGSGGSTGGSGESGGSISKLPVATKDTLGGIKVGQNLTVLADGTLSVNTTNQMEQDNTLPITSAGVYNTVGNIEVLLATI